MSGATRQFKPTDGVTSVTIAGITMNVVDGVLEVPEEHAAAASRLGFVQADEKAATAAD